MSCGCCECGNKTLALVENQEEIEYDPVYDLEGNLLGHIPILYRVKREYRFKEAKVATSN